MTTVQKGNRATKSNVEGRNTGKSKKVLYVVDLLWREKGKKRQSFCHIREAKKGDGCQWSFNLISWAKRKSQTFGDIPVHEDREITFLGNQNNNAVIEEDAKWKWY